jgi:thiamine pyrophosphokinase
MTDLVVVFAGGDAPTPASVADLPDDAHVIAADSGADHALDLAWPVHEAVGDFDSINPMTLFDLRAAFARIEAHPPAKDQTDLELALDRAIERTPARVVIIGGHGGRFDHWLGNTLLMTAEKYRNTRLQARFGDTKVDVVWDRLVVDGEPGQLVSLFAVRGPVTGISTTGLGYPLQGETLLPASSRGVSNELVDATAEIVVAEGPLVVVRPAE